MAKIMELPVIQKEKVRKTIKTQCGGEKPRVPSPRNLARIQGNSKTEPNVSDTTKGCAGGCFGCYAARSMGFLQGGLIFTDPVTQCVCPEIIQHDIYKMMSNNVYVNDDGAYVLNWVRNGTLGDPSYDWDAACRFAEAAGRIGVRTVVITKMWKFPSDLQLERLAIAGAIIHFSLIPGYEWAPHIAVGRRKDENRVQTVLSILVRFDKMTRPKKSKFADSVFMRICSASFDRENPVGELLDETQKFFYEFSKKYGIRILETPWKFEGNDPRNDYLLHENMEHVKSYTTGKAGRKKSAGMLLSDKGFDKYKDWDTFVIACDTRCDECPNQCGTMTQKPILLEKSV